jgi:anti-sigma factor RsiW
VACPSTETLILHHDGELSSRQRQALETHVRSCANCAASLKSLAEQRALAREAIEADLEQVSFAGLTQRVMRGIEVERPVALRDRVRVWIEEFVEHRRRVWVPALAAAAVLAMLGGFWGGQPSMAPPEPGGSAVLSIRATSAAIVFDIPSQDGLSSTAVVWVNDEEPEEGGSGT